MISVEGQRDDETRGQEKAIVYRKYTDVERYRLRAVKLPSLRAQR